MPDTLLGINRKTFRAEELKDVNKMNWETYLRSVLSDDFKIKRANRSIKAQNIEEMIDFMKQMKNDGKYNSNKREILEKTIFERPNCGVVTSIVTLKGAPGQFHNMKIFARQEQEWKCVYWEVTNFTLKLPEL